MKQPYYYLDHAAATPLDDRVVTAMQPYLQDDFFNPSGPYAPAVEVRRDYESAKHRLAICIGAKLDEIVITAGATESINLMIHSTGGHIVTTAIEHHAVLEAVAQREHTLVAVGPSGVVRSADVRAAITPKTQLVSIALANNEIGTVQPMREIGEIVRAERARRIEAGEAAPIYFHSDASQGAGQLDINVARLGLDALTLNAGKMYGPKQVGLLWVASRIELIPLVVGGGQERGLRSGTENVAGVVGFATALELVCQRRKSESVRLGGLRDYLQQRLCDAFPDAIVTGSYKKRLAGHLHISFPGIDAERLVFALESRRVLVATGSACAANYGTRSHVLTALGVAPDIADGSLRITLGHLNDDTNIREAADILVEVIGNEYRRVGR